MKLVKHLLDTKGRHIISISPDASVFDAIKLMADKSIGSLVVMDDDAKLLGIVTERDYARKVIIKGRSSKETRVEDIMSTDVMTTSSDHRVDQCMELMTEKKIRHLPVVDDDHGRRHDLDRRSRAGHYCGPERGNRAPRTLHQWLIDERRSRY